ncbi:hypothetical protein D9M73_62660 [compost metagenome]
MIHLRQRVADRRAGGENHALAAPILGIHLVSLDVHVIGALAAGAVTQALHLLHFGAEHQVLEHVRFVNEELVDADLLEVKEVIHGLIAQAANAVFKPLLHGLQLLDGPALRRLLAVAELHALDGGHDLLDLLGVEIGLKLRSWLDEPVAAVRDDHRVPVTRRNAGQKFAAVGLLKVLLGGRQHVGTRVKAVEVGGPLLHQVIRHCHHGLAGQASAFQLHGARHDRERLAGPDHVVEQRRAVLHDAGDCIALVPAELDDAVGHFAREGHVGAVVHPRDVVVVGLVVSLGQQLGALRVAEQPVIEAILHFLGFGVRHFGGVHVGTGLLLPVDVGNLDAAVVQQRIQHLVARVGRRAPRVAQGQRVAATHPKLIRAVGLQVGDADLGVFAEQFVGEVRVNAGRHPWGTDPRHDFMAGHLGRLNRLQRRHVGEHPGRLGLRQLGAHVARQVGVAQHIFVAGRVAEQQGLLARAQCLQHRVRFHAQQFADVAGVQLAALGHRHLQRVGRRVHLLNLLARSDHALGKDGALAGGRFGGLYTHALRCGQADAWRVAVLQGGQQGEVRVILEHAQRTGVVDEAVGLAVGVVLLVERRAQGLHGLGVVAHFRCQQAAHRAAHASQRLDAFEAGVAQFGLFGPLSLRGNLHAPRLAAQIRQALHELVGIHEIAALADGRALQGRDGGLGVLGSASLGHAAVDSLGQLANGFLEHRHRVLPWPGHQRREVGAIHAAVGAEVAQHHAGVVDEVLVERDGFAAPVLDLAHGQPALGVLARGLAANLAVRPLLQEHQVRRHVGAGVLGKGVVGHPDGAQELDPLTDVFARRLRLAVHERVGDDLGHDAALAQHVDGLGEEVVVQAQAGQVLAAAAVGLRVTGKRRVAHGRVVVGVSAAKLSEIALLDVLLWVKLTCDRARKRLSLDGCKPACATHVRRHQPHEVAHAGAGLQGLAAREAKAAQGSVYPVFDYFAAGVVGVAGGLARRGQLFGAHQRGEFGVLFGPVGILGVEGLRQTAPANILGQHCLLVRRRQSAGAFQLCQQPDGGHVVFEFGLLAALTQRQLVGDGEVFRLDLRRGDGGRIGRRVGPGLRGQSSGGIPKEPRPFISSACARYPWLFGILGACSGSSGRNRYCSLTCSHASCCVAPCVTSTRIPAAVASAASVRACSSVPAFSRRAYIFGRCSFQCSRA